MTNDQAILYVYNTARKAALASTDAGGYPLGDSAAHLVALKALLEEAEAVRREADRARDTDALFQAGYDLIRQGHWKWVKSLADDLETKLRETYEPWQDWDEFTRETIEQHIDGTCIYNIDISCVLLASNNSSYADDEGLVSKDADNADMVRAHYALVEDVREELEHRGALEEPEPEDDDTEIDAEADTERATDPRIAYHGDGEAPAQEIDIDAMLAGH